MRVPLSWLRDFVDIEVPVEWLADRMTMAGLEVSKIEHIGQNWDRDRIRVGEILEVNPHPRADRLTIATVVYGSGKVAETVSGAPNIQVGDKGGKVVLALPGASFLDPHSDDSRTVVLKATKIKGIRSEGMLCSEKELGISEDHSGVMMLDADAPVGIPLQDYMGDTVLDLDLTPNLGRCLSIIGVAREVAALTRQHVKELPPEAFDLTEKDGWKYLTDQDPAKATASYVNIAIHEPELCPRYSACLIEGVTIRPSPMWMQNRLRLAGMRPINNVVDVTNYCMWEWGQPLHAFDYEKVRGGKISVRRARPGEEIVTLDGVLRKLTKYDLLITDGEGPVAIAGVMGGFDSEVTDSTRSILLESANFNLTSIRRTVQMLKLPSEASLRFGKGIDPEVTIPTLKRASLLVKEISGASICSEIADAYPLKAQEKLIHLSTEEVRRILGMDFSTKEISEILESLTFRCKEAGESETLTVTVPTYRLDVSIPADLIEELARVHGYEKIPTTLLEDTLPPQRRNPYLEFEERTRDIMVGCGLREIITYSMTNMDSVSKLFPEMKRPDPSKFIGLVNPISPDKAFMRQSLLPGMLETLCFNSRISDQLMFFEIGRVYFPNHRQELPDERPRLGIVISAHVERTWWGESGSVRVGFFHLKGILEALFRRIGIFGYSYEALSRTPFHPGKSAIVRIGGIEIGIAGELHPDVARNFELSDQGVVAAEFDMEEMFRRRKEWRYEAISSFPAAKEDLAAVVGEEILAQEIVNVVMEAGRPLVKEVAIFDVWKGKNIPGGKKSVAFSMTYQAADRVLKADEIKRTREKIIRRLSDVLGAKLRE